jgi:hypothetical protein
MIKQFIAAFAFMFCIMSSLFLGVSASIYWIEHGHPTYGFILGLFTISLNVAAAVTPVRE